MPAGGTAPTADPARARPRPWFTCCLSNAEVRLSSRSARAANTAASCTPPITFRGSARTVGQSCCASTCTATVVAAASRSCTSPRALRQGPLLRGDDRTPQADGASPAPSLLRSRLAAHHQQWQPRRLYSPHSYRDRHSLEDLRVHILIAVWHLLEKPIKSGRDLRPEAVSLSRLSAYRSDAAIARLAVVLNDQSHLGVLLVAHVT
jgi:hypothetical protein